MPIRRFCKDFYLTFMLHAVAAHFNNGLLPAAAVFMLLALATGDRFYEHTVLHMTAVSLCMIPVSFVSGIRDWRTRYRGGKAPIFYRKVYLTLLLFLLVLAAVGLRLARPDVLMDGGILRWMYAGALGMGLSVAVLLGHYGGKLAYQGKAGEK